MKTMILKKKSMDSFIAKARAVAYTTDSNSNGNVDQDAEPCCCLKENLSKRI